MMKDEDQKQLGKEKVFFDLHFYVAVNRRRKSGKELIQGRKLEARANAEAMEGMLLTSLLIMACSSSFLIESRATSPGMVLSTRGCAPRHQLTIKKIPCKFSCSLKYGGIFLTGAPFLF